MEEGIWQWVSETCTDISALSFVCGMFWGTELSSSSLFLIGQRRLLKMPLQGCWVINPGDVGKVPRAGFDPCKLWYVTVSTIIFSFHMPFEGLSGGKDLLHRWDQSRGGPRPEGRTALPAFEYFLRVRVFSPRLIFVSSRLISCSFNKHLSSSIVSNPGVSRVRKT